MKIENRYNRASTYFVEINVGDCFYDERNNDLHMKTNPDINDGGILNAVNFDKNSLVFFSGDETVYPCNAKIVIE